MKNFNVLLSKISVDRLSRHLYDVVKLSKSAFVEKALNDKELYGTIVEHRYKFTKLGGVDYNLHQRQSINTTPSSKLIETWKADYNKMYLFNRMSKSNAITFDLDVKPKIIHLSFLM